MLFLFLFPLAVLAQVPSYPVRVDLQSPSRTFKLTWAAGSSPVLAAYVSDGGRSFTNLSGWTGYVYVAVTPTAGVYVAASPASSNRVNFAFTASQTATVGTFGVEIVLGNGTNTYRWGTGSLSLSNSPALLGAGTVPLTGVFNWDLYTFTGTPPALSASYTNELAGDVTGVPGATKIAAGVVGTNNLTPEVRGMLASGVSFNPTQLVWNVAAIAADSTNELVIPPGTHYFSYWNTNTPVIGTFPTNGNVGDILYVSVATNGPIATFPFTEYELQSDKTWVYSGGSPGTNISFSHITYYQNVGTSSVSLNLKNQRVYFALKFGHTISDFDGYWLARSKYAAQYRIVDALRLNGELASYYLDNTNSTGGFSTPVLTNLWAILQSLGPVTNVDLTGTLPKGFPMTNAIMTGTTTSTGTLVVSASDYTSILIRATSGTLAPSTRIAWEWTDAGGTNRYCYSYVSAAGEPAFHNGSVAGAHWWSGNFTPANYQTAAGAASFFRWVSPVASNTSAGTYREAFVRNFNGTNYLAFYTTNNVWYWTTLNTNAFPWQ